VYEALFAPICDVISSQFLATFNLEPESVAYSELRLENAPDYSIIMHIFTRCRSPEEEAEVAKASVDKCQKKRQPLTKVCSCDARCA
jgi:hypothetical protein